METGKVEAAPNKRRFSYGCSKCGAFFEYGGTLEHNNDVHDYSPEVARHQAMHAEHARLKDAVVEASVNWYRSDEPRALKTRLKESIRALIAFEAEHEIGETK